MKRILIPAAAATAVLVLAGCNRTEEPAPANPDAMTEGGMAPAGEPAAPSGSMAGSSAPAGTTGEGTMAPAAPGSSAPGSTMPANPQERTPGNATLQGDSPGSATPLPEGQGTTYSRNDERP